MSVSAYLLCGIDIRVSPPKVKWVDVFSEENPTSPLHSRTFLVHKTTEQSYALALVAMAKSLTAHGQFFDWALPLLTDRAIGALFGRSFPRPPSKLTQLSTIPQNEWIGSRVYHPMCQMGDTPIWRDRDNPYPDPESNPSPDEWDYDLGSVTRFAPDWIAGTGWEPRAEVWFTSGSGELHYPATNLWVYRGFHS